MRILMIAIAAALFGCTSDNGQSGPSAGESATTGSEASAACGVEYPEAFPCLPGGEVLARPETSLFPNVRIVAVVGYRLAAAELDERLAEAAAGAGWSLSQSEAGAEPGGTRFRSTFTRSERAVDTSVFPVEAGSVLLVTLVRR